MKHQIPWSKVLLENLTTYKPVKKFLTFYGTQTFSSMFTRAHHLPLPWARWIHSTYLQSIGVRSILILSNHLCQTVSFLQISPQNHHHRPVPTVSGSVIMNSAVQYTDVCHWCLHRFCTVWLAWGVHMWRFLASILPVLHKGHCLVEVCLEVIVACGWPKSSHSNLPWKGSEIDHLLVALPG
jgi:hypothetical protein